MKSRSPALGHHVDSRTRLRAVLGAVGTGNQSEFLDRIDADVVDQGAPRTVIDVADAVERRRRASPQSVNRRIIGAHVGPLLRIVVDGAGARGQVYQLCPVAPIKR